MKRSDLLQRLINEQSKARSQWRYAVTDYALEILMNNTDEEINSVDDVLNYARAPHESLYDVAQMQSHGGCFEIYDDDIALRVCTPSEIKRCTRKDGSFRDMANSRESWLDVQGRAVFQAYSLIQNIIKLA